MNVLLCGPVYGEDFNYIRPGNRLKIISEPSIDLIQDYNSFLNNCEKSDLVIFNLSGRLPNKFIADLKSLKILSRFKKLTCKKVMWSQDSHHTYKEERLVQDYFDKFYLAHSRYMCKFKQNLACHLPCCYTASSIDTLCQLNSGRCDKIFDVGSFYRQYQIGKRNEYFVRAKSICNRMKLTSFFGRAYGMNNGIKHGNLLYGLRSTNVVLNIPLLDDLNIRNFESIALNCNLVTIKTPDHSLVDVSYENVFFFKEDFSDFEEQLRLALDNDAQDSEAWLSIVNKHTLMHRYLDIINQELDMDFSLDISSAIYSASKSEAIPKFTGFEGSEITVYSDENLFSNAFLTIVNRGGSFDQILQNYHFFTDSGQGLCLDEVINCLENLASLCSDNNKFIIFFICFLTTFARYDKAIGCLQKHKLENICDDFMRLYSSKSKEFTTISLFKFNETLYKTSLKTLGILNFENPEVTGESYFLKNYLNSIKDAIVFDVGANAGNYSLLVKSINRDAKIFAFEPNPFIYKSLKKNAKSNGFVSLNLGLSNSEGVMTLYDRADVIGSEHASLYKEVISDLHRRDAVLTDINVTTIDALMVSLGLEKIDLLKIDTEGHEYNVLCGASKTLSDNKIDAIHFEFNEMNVVSRVFMRDFFSLLAGFVFFRMLPDGLLPLGEYRALTHEIFAFQNIIALNRSNIS